jgi:hypothetical protein
VESPPEAAGLYTNPRRAESSSSSLPSANVRQKDEEKNPAPSIGMWGKGKVVSRPSPGRLRGARLGGARLLKIRLGLLDLVVMLIDGALEYPHVGLAGLSRQLLEPLAFTPALIG